MAYDHHHHRPTTTTIESLPNHLLSEVLAMVGSSSMDDLYKLKTCCKNFRSIIEEEDYIYQHVSMQKLPYVPWFITPEESSFLTRCRQSGNPESLYREGMVKYFSLEPLDDDDDSGFGILKEASNKGHREASYVCGMILLCSEVDDERKQALELLRSLGKMGCVKTCRNKAEACLRMMWKNTNRVRTLFGNRRERLCGSNMCRVLQEIARLERGWPSMLHEEDAVLSCELCRWDYELRQFSMICCS